MEKKGQNISLFVIAGLVIVIVVSLAFLWANNSGKGKLDSDVKSMDLSGGSSNLEMLMEGCLKEATIESIEIYGLQDVETKLSDQISRSVVKCIDNFSSFRESGFEVESGTPKVSASMNEDLLIVEMFYPVSLKKGDNLIKVENFKFQLYTISELKSEGDTFAKDHSLVSQDNNAILSIVTDTQAFDSDGKPVDNIKIKLMDKNFDGSENDVVLGSVVYAADPDGISFSTPVKMTIRLKKTDLPADYNSGSPKIGFYSFETGLWRTYPSCGFQDLGDYYSYCAMVDHFTPIALLGCGNDDDNEILFDMYGTNDDGVLGGDMPYSEIIEPAVQEMWIPTEDKEEPIMMVPEMNIAAFCKLDTFGLNRRYYDLEKKYAGYYWIEDLCDQSRDDGLFKDWDEDDKPEKSTYASYSYDLTFSEGSNAVTKDKLSNPIFSDAKADEYCYYTCRDTARKYLKCYFNGDCEEVEGIEPLPEDLRYDPFEFNGKIFLKNGAQPSTKILSIVSGDGLFDGAKLKCELATVTSGGGTDIVVPLAGTDMHKCIIDDSVNNLKKTKSLPAAKYNNLGEYFSDLYDNITYGSDSNNDVPFAEKTMFNKGITGVFATPKTFGYETIEGDTDDVSGDGYYMFNIDTDTCIDTWNYEPNVQASAIEAQLLDTKGKVLHSFVSGGTSVTLTDSTGKSCSAGDSCEWSLNYAIDGKERTPVPSGYTYGTFEDGSLYSEIRWYSDVDQIPYDANVPGFNPEIPGELRVGINLVGVSLANKDAGNKVSAYAKGIIKLKGKINSQPHKGPKCLDGFECLSEKDMLLASFGCEDPAKSTRGISVIDDKLNCDTGESGDDFGYCFKCDQASTSSADAECRELTGISSAKCLTYDAADAAEMACETPQADGRIGIPSKTYDDLCVFDETHGQGVCFACLPGPELKASQECDSKHASADGSGFSCVSDFETLSETVCGDSEYYIYEDGCNTGNKDEFGYCFKCKESKGPVLCKSPYECLDDVEYSEAANECADSEDGTLGNIPRITEVNNCKKKDEPFVFEEFRACFYCDKKPTLSASADCSIHGEGYSCVGAGADSKQLRDDLRASCNGDATFIEGCDPAGTETEGYCFKCKPNEQGPATDDSYCVDTNGKGFSCVPEPSVESYCVGPYVYGFSCTGGQGVGHCIKCLDEKI